MANLLRPIPSSFPYTGLLATLVLAAPAAFAFPSLTTEPRRRAPGSTTMAFSPLAITGYTLLAIVASYALLRLYRYLKPHFPSTTRGTLPQPVSAGRTSSLSLFSPFSLRTRPKSIKTALTWSRWSPLPALFRRFTRPSSPLHLSGMELLPTTMPSPPPANAHSLIDLPLMTGSFPVSKGQAFKHTRLLSRSSSMDVLPAYRPLTPVPVLVPVPVRVAPLAPSTPPPPSPTPIPGVSGLDIPLVPVVPPKPQFMPMATTNPSGLPTPPLTGTFPATTLSPSKLSSTRALASNVVGSRPRSPSPSLFLSSHTISSLSLSPRSLSQQQHRRSKSLGGVAVKKISPPSFDWDEAACTQDVVDSKTEFENKSQAHTLIVPAHMLIVPALEQKEKERDRKMQGRHSPTPSSGSSRFLLNFSSSSSSSGSGQSLGSPSPSPLTSNSGSTPASVPLLTPRTISSSSRSSDIAKLSEQTSLLPRPIPLVDVDTNIDKGMMQDLTGNNSEKALGWSFDVDEPTEVAVAAEQVLLDLDTSVPVPPPAYMGAQLVDLDLAGKEKGDQRLTGIEEVDAVESEQSAGEKWEWDADLESQDGCWGVEAQAETVSAPQMDTWHLDEPVPENGIVPSSLAATSATIPELSESEAEAKLVYPDPDLLPLPDVVNVLPSATPARVMDLPTITISTQDAVLCKGDSDPEPDIYTPSKGTSTPVLQAQTPTPPASPPREARMSPLPKAGSERGWGHGELSPGGSTLPSPVVGECPAAVCVEAQQEVPVVAALSAAGEDDPTPPEGDQSDVEEAVEEDESEEDTEEHVVVLDRGFVRSPESISEMLSEPDVLPDVGSTAGSTDVEAIADWDEDGVSGIGYEVVPASPSAMVPSWDYGYDEDEGEGRDEEVAKGEEAKDVKPCMVEIVPDPELQPEPLPGSAKLVSVPEHELQRGSISLAPAQSPALELSTSLPETLPTSVQATKPELQEPSPPQEIRQRKRTALEEAVERTRSPLEVALAMQLRPGLGVGADPAWMVRFLMVMWGWVFGMVLVPFA